MDKLYKYTFGQGSVIVHECLVTGDAGQIVWYHSPTRDGSRRVYSVNKEYIDETLVAAVGRKSVILSTPDISKARSIVKAYYDKQIAEYEAKIREKAKAIDDLEILPVEEFKFR